VKSKKLWCFSPAPDLLTAEQAGFKPISIVLTRDTGMKKKGFSEDIGKGMKAMMEYISDDDIKKAKELIVKTVLA
jgi:hypothetical protein